MVPIDLKLNEEEYQQMQALLEILLAEKRNKGGFEKFMDIITNEETKRPLLMLIGRFVNYMDENNLDINDFLNDVLDNKFLNEDVNEDDFDEFIRKRGN